MTSSCPDSDNSWVLAGSENLPVETLGPEPRMDPESVGASQALSDPSKADGEELTGTLDGEGKLFQTEGSWNESATLPEEMKAKGTLGCDGHGMEPPGDTFIQEDLQETPVATSLGPDTQDLENESPPQNLPSSPKAVWKECHCSSSDDDTDVDVEGLRRRRGREPSPAQPATPMDAEDQAKGEGVGGELGISLNMCLLGTLVLLGLGILLFSGSMEEAELQVFPDTGLETELVDTVGNRKAQKEELQNLLHQPQGLEEENARLREALQQGKTSHQALELELQQLRARLQGLEANCVRGADGVCLNWGGGPSDKATKEQGHKGQEPDPSLLEQHKRLEAEAQALRQELQRQWQLLGSVHRDLQRGLQNAGQGAPAHAGLAELGHMLAQTLQGLENWGHNNGIPANDSEAWYQKKPHFQNSREWSRKEKWHGGPRHQKAEHWKHGKEESGQDEHWKHGKEESGRDEHWKHRKEESGRDEHWKHRKEESGRDEHWKHRKEESGRDEHWKHRKEESGQDEHWKHRKEESGRKRKRSWRDGNGEATGVWKEDKPRVEELGNRKDGKRQDFKVYPRKSGDSHSGERQKPSWGKDNSPDPLSSWEELLKRKYRPPQGCSGVDDCARQEGLTFFGTELAPVRLQELASVLRTYLERLPWAGQLTKELPLLPAYFGEDGIFRHDRLRFRDFVDALEDSLEEAALKQMGDDDEVDDFEDFIFSHFFGDKALKKRSRRKEKHSWNHRVVGPREEHDRHPHHYYHG
ncbi:pre-B-cell leukemia transcription factor-interacting protein 1 isoform X5 [Cricetulus griseus]|uniref:Pre-B-cell leukemia transcription factor-interacting protein 1 isoform X5 n=1 Tax=Cricetulus griseus TaxID=10029 RepID=A0A9J7F736_CRIGR|nr:pre-B-cell leukemia transcription factor-interacting protein 1 isoform X5 [Cricetulus griseus]